MPTIHIHGTHVGERLDSMLTKTIAVSRSQIQRLIKQHAITVNDRQAKPSQILERDDVISYHQIERPATAQDRNAPALDVIYEDDDILVINKPAGLLVHDASPEEHRSTVVDGLLRRYPEIARVGDDPTRPGIVHRLDKDVSGLMVIAKTQKAFDSLKYQFRTRTIKKEYLALVYGSLPKETDTIFLKIGRSRRTGRMVARPEKQEGKEAATQYDVFKRFATATYVRVLLLTGRTHQIRAHFHAIGHPIVGDHLYRAKRMKFREFPLHRLFLHSYKLTFRRMDGKEKTVTAPLPKDLANLLSSLPIL